MTDDEVRKSIYENDTSARTTRTPYSDIRGMKESADTKSAAPQAAPLTKEEKAAVTQACLTHANLVLAIAKQFLRPGFDLEDLTQIGYEGLVQAVREWRPEGGASLATIANLRIRDALRAATAVRRDMHRVSGSFDEPSGDDSGDYTLHDLVGEEATQEIEFEQREAVEVIKRALTVLPESDQNTLLHHTQGERQMVRDTGTPKTSLRRAVSRAKSALLDAFENTPSAILQAA